VLEIISGLLSQLLQHTSVSGAVAAIVVLSVVGLVGMRLKSRWESERQVLEQKAAAEISQSQVVIQNLMQEVAESRKQMIDHMNRDRREKDRLVRTLGSVVSEIRASVKVMDAIKVELARHCDSCRDRHESLRELILKSEIRRKEDNRGY
jgi:ribosomal protein L44E